MGKFRIPETEMFAVEVTGACLRNIEGPLSFRQNMEMRVKGDGDLRVIEAIARFPYSLSFHITGTMTRRCGEWSKAECTVMNGTGEQRVSWKFTCERRANQLEVVMVETTAKVPNPGIFNPRIKLLANTLRRHLPEGSQHLLFRPPFIDPTTLADGTVVAADESGELEKVAKAILALLPIDKVTPEELSQENEFLMLYYGITTGLEGELFVHSVPC